MLRDMRRWLLWKRGAGWAVPLLLISVVPVWLGYEGIAWKVLVTLALVAFLSLWLLEWRVRRRHRGDPSRFA